MIPFDGLAFLTSAISRNRVGASDRFQKIFRWRGVLGEFFNGRLIAAFLSSRNIFPLRFDNAIENGRHQ